MNHTALRSLGRFFVLVAATIAAATALAVPVRNPANGHYYEHILVPDVNLNTDWVTWADAQATASNLNWFGFPGRLAVILSEQENDFIVNSVLKSSAVAGNDSEAWLGGQFSPTGTLSWTTGQTVAFTNISDSPDDFAPGPDPPAQSSCLEMILGDPANSGSGGWADSECTETHSSYVVEFLVVPPVQVPTLNPTAMALLAALAGIAGVFFVRRGRSRRLG